MKPKKVLVTGCFDVLHQEHIKFLKAAKKQGDILLIGLESDARTKKLKGKGRPINPINTRLKNLAQLNLADHIFPLPEKFNSSKDHETLIKKIKPDILAISSHTPNQPQKKNIIEKYGGQLKVVHPRNPRISTSKMIK
jgi:D-beta-D-heptose 7-phosphate kinase/D-beta-D-heptose 1-phosphate adenosyltransferase